MNSRRCLVLVVFGLLVTSGCGDHPGSGGDAGVSESNDFATTADDLSLSGTDMAPAPNGGDGGSACNSLVNAAPIVKQTLVNQPMPSPTMGGTIAPGTYYLTESKLYLGAGMMPRQLQATQSINGTTVQTVQHTSNSPDSVHDTRMYTTAGTTLTITFICGGVTGMTTLGYDATPTQYTTYNNTSRLVNVWTRQ
jgi:hypothetical protein